MSQHGLKHDLALQKMSIDWICVDLGVSAWQHRHWDLPQTEKDSTKKAVFRETEGVTREQVLAIMG